MKQISIKTSIDRRMKKNVNKLGDEILFHITDVLPYPLTPRVSNVRLLRMGFTF